MKELDWYQTLIHKIILNGEFISTSRGDTLTCVGEHLTFDVSEILPITTARKIFYKKAAKELYCYLQGYHTKEQFNSAGVTWWNEEFKQHGNDFGLRYGAAWRDFKGINQIVLIKERLKQNINTRTAIVFGQVESIYGDTFSLPCLSLFQITILNDKLFITVYQRSADVFLGLPYDIITMALLGKLFANEFDIKNVILDYHICNAHIYHNDLLACLMLINNKIYKSPAYELTSGLNDYQPIDLYVYNYKTNPQIKTTINLKQK